jgi:DNA-binding NtrC family response regulator
LYYRLNVFLIVIPPLRERPEDIPPLTRHFLDRAAQRLQRPTQQVTQDTIDRLTAYPWPGNVRELESVIERAVVLSQGAVIRLEDDLRPPTNRDPPAPESRPMWMPGPRRTPATDPDHLFEVLKQVGGNQTKAARLLGIGRTTLWRRLKTYRPQAETGQTPDVPAPEKTTRAD